MPCVPCSKEVATSAVHAPVKQGTEPMHTSSPTTTSTTLWLCQGPSQKLIAAVALLGAMHEPATPEGRNLCHEVQTLIEEVARKQAESSASRMHHSSSSRRGEACEMGQPRSTCHSGMKGREPYQQASDSEPVSNNELTNSARPRQTRMTRGHP